MGYDVTNNSSIVELGPGKSVPSGTDLTPIELPDELPSQEILVTENVTPVGEVVELPNTLPSPELIAVPDAVRGGNPITIPDYIPPDGIVLLETIPIPTFLQDGGGAVVDPGVSRLEDLDDVDLTARADDYILVYDAATNTYVHEVKPTGGTESTFASDITVVLSGGKTFGKYSNGEVIPAAGKTAVEVMLDVAIEYVASVFASFSVSGQSTTIEVGTTLSGSKTFTWSVTLNSGTVPTITIYDGTAASNLLTDTTNDGSEAVTITTIQLNSEAATQRWRGIGTDVTPDPDVVFYSSYFTVTARYYRFFGAVAASVTDSASVRALPSSTFQTGTDTFNLSTGSTLTKFVVALPPGVTISSVIDLDALNADITSEYIAQSSINVLDAGGTNRAYNIYEMNVGSPYSSDHRHQITAG